MGGWYLVYILMLGLHGFLMASEDVRPFSVKWWIWVFVPVLSHIAGKAMVP
jgi:hypothetical protein